MIGDDVGGGLSASIIYHMKYSIWYPKYFFKFTRQQIQPIVILEITTTK